MKMTNDNLHKIDKKILVIHAGDDPQSGGIQRMSYDTIQAFERAGILGETVGPQTGKFSQALSYFRKARNCRGGTYILHSGLAKLLLLRRPCEPVFVVLHGTEVWAPFGRLHNWILRKTTRFIADTQFTWDQFVRWHPDLAKVPHEVLHLGLGESADYKSPDEKTPAALIISRLDKGEDYKGHRELIAVWHKVRQSIPLAELWIAGDGNLRGELESITPPSSGIHFLGRISAEEKETRLARCRCVAMPSRGEGFGLVYLEAMRLGRPCLVSDEDSGREVVNPPEAGIAVNQKDAAGMAEALIFLLGDSPERKEMGIRAKKRYDERFTVEHYRRRLLKVVNCSDIKECVR